MTVRAACQWYNISPQAHYQMLQRRALRSQVEAYIIERVQEIRQELPMLGGRKLLYLLRPFLEKFDIALGRDRFFALLRRKNMLIHRKRKATRTTFPGGVRSENLLTSAVISRPNQAIVADITYIDTDAAFLYLALVTDLASRKIIGWDLSNSLSLEGAHRAMTRAIRHIRQAGGKTQGMIHHSDHGVQYTSRAYLALLKKADIRSSMGAVGNAYDNAVAERVNGILKLEFLLDQRFSDSATARRAVIDAIRLYNNKRPHLSLNYATPAEAYTRGLQQSKAQPAIAEPLLEAPSQSRGADGVCLRLAQPLTGSSFLIHSELAGCADAIPL